LRFPSGRHWLEQKLFEVKLRLNNYGTKIRKKDRSKILILFWKPLEQ